MQRMHGAQLMGISQLRTTEYCADCLPLGRRVRVRAAHVNAMSSPPDDVLQLLRQRGRDPDPSALDSLMRGVAAAPEGLAGPEWVELIDPKPMPN